MSRVSIGLAAAVILFIVGGIIIYKDSDQDRYRVDASPLIVNDSSEYRGDTVGVELRLYRLGWGREDMIQNLRIGLTDTTKTLKDEMEEIRLILEHYQP